MTPPPQLVANGVFFPAFTLGPDDCAPITLNVFNANPADLRLEVGAPLALIVLLPFTRIPADVTSC